MSRPASAQVRERLQAYLLGVESLPALHAWFVGWRRENPDGGDSFTHDIELRLAEYTRGHWSEPQLRGLLLGLLEGPTLALNRLDKPELSQRYGPYETHSEVSPPLPS
jgi:hypothetical protein